MSDTENKTALVISAHPDDSAIGPPATLSLLLQYGWKVTDFCCSLGGRDPETQARRRAELEEASRRAGFSLKLTTPLLALNSSSEPWKQEVDLTAQIERTIRTLRPRVVVAPHPHEGHPGHEVVARATVRALEAMVEPPALWTWNIWGDQSFPSLYVPFDENTLQRVLGVLEAYDGENRRMPYADMVSGRARLNHVLGSEKVFGYGSSVASALPYAEVLGEFVRVGKEWRKGKPRVFDPSNPLTPPTTTDLTWWLHAPSTTTLQRGVK
jgi:LmbE family N-acetylglucosaminyl deacetylase